MYTTIRKRPEMKKKSEGGIDIFFYKKRGIYMYYGAKILSTIGVNN